MKGGKDEEKTMGPMFPRLHVNDTDKGGPRAPPRNKMALYEQLSVPSQRFSSGSQQINNTSNLVPSASFGQGTGQERTMFSSFRIPPPAPPHSVDTSNSRCATEGLDLRTNVQNFEKEYMKAANDQISNPSMHFQPAAACRPFNPNDLMNSKNFFMGKLGNEDDFRVPTFGNSQKDSCLNKDQHGVNREKLTSLSPSHPGHTTNQGDTVQKVVPSTCSSSTHHQNARDKHLKRTNTTDLRSRQHSRDHSEENPLDSATSKDSAGNTTSRPPARENIAEHLKHAYPSLVQEQCIPTDNLEGLHDTNAHSRQECRAEFVLENITHGDGEQVLPMANGNIVWVTNKSCRASHGNDDNESCEEKTERLLQAEDVDRNDDASETSMVDSITVLDISPDDVVGAIGQKHFWKARRAIVNQQRLFAVQVFELHRLIKVQRLIAGSPHLLLDDTSSNKPCPKVLPPKKLTIEYALKSSQQIVKEKTESQKPGQSTECAAENAVRRPPISDGVNGGRHSSYGPPSVNPVPAPAPAPTPAPTPTPTPTPTSVMAENKAPWFFHPPPGNQWLVPVMSPSEGLVYKPYAGPCPPTGGFMAPMYGGCGPMSMTPMGGEFPGASYRLPSPHPQGMGVLSGAPPLPQTYFSPYGMPVMNSLISSSAVEQANAMAGARSLGQGVQLSTGEVNFNMQSRNSCNMSNQKGEGASHLYKFQASKESERQGSTASSPSEREHGTGPENVPEGRDALSLFPMGPAVQAPSQPQTHSSGPQRTRAIKVVPHNSRSATESAARIFQSIQEERQHHESV